MAGRTQSVKRRVADSLKFWLIVAVFCGVAGASAYQVGKHYVGSRLHDMELKQRAPEIVPQASPAAGNDESGEPPAKPVITMTEREPTAREAREAERELDRPQDGAQLHAAESSSDRDEGRPAATADEPERPATATPSSRGGYSVVAGSFASEANAQRQVQRLAERGYQATITTIERDGVTYQRVNVGGFATREQAEELQGRLRSQGFEAAVWSE